MIKLIRLAVSHIALLFFSTLAIFSQTKTLVLPQPIPEPPPGNINLLQGYVHEPRRGIDAAVGSFNRSDGFAIKYLIGSNAGNSAYYRFQSEKNNVVWFKQQWLPNDLINLTIFKDGELIASFVKAKANFIANTKTNADIADFLLTVMTYSPIHLVQERLKRKK